MAQFAPWRKRCGSPMQGYYDLSDAGSSPVRPTKQLRIDTSRPGNPKALPTSDTEDDTGSPTTPTLLQRVGLDHRDMSSDVKDEPGDTTTSSESEELALALGLKVQKRNKQLDVAKNRITTLNEWLQEAGERERILKDEVHGLKLRETNWKRSSKIVRTVLDSADTFRA